MFHISIIRALNLFRISGLVFRISAAPAAAFMQNKPNLLNDQMNVNNVLTVDYENKTLGERGKNKPNSNPIKPN